MKSVNINYNINGEQLHTANEIPTRVDELEGGEQIASNISSLQQEKLDKHLYVTQWEYGTPESPYDILQINNVGDDSGFVIQNINEETDSGLQFYAGNNTIQLASVDSEHFGSYFATIPEEVIAESELIELSAYDTEQHRRNMVTISKEGFKYNNSDVLTENNTLNKYETEDTVNTTLYETYDITVTVIDGTFIGNTIIPVDGTAEVVITPDAECVLPTTISVSNATYTYNSTTGVVQLSAPTGNVAITANCSIHSDSGVILNEIYIDHLQSFPLDPNAYYQTNIYDTQLLYNDTQTPVAFYTDDNMPFAVMIDNEIVYGTLEKQTTGDLNIPYNYTCYVENANHVGLGVALAKDCGGIDTSTGDFIYSPGQYMILFTTDALLDNARLIYVNHPLVQDSTLAGIHFALGGIPDAPGQYADYIVYSTPLKYADGTLVNFGVDDNMPFAFTADGVTYTAQLPLTSQEISGLPENGYTGYAMDQQNINGLSLVLAKDCGGIDFDTGDLIYEEGKYIVSVMSNYQFSDVELLYVDNPNSQV